MKKINFTTDKFIVIGLGDTGVSIIKYLRFKKANVIRVLDTRNDPPNQNILNNIPLICGNLTINNLLGVDYIIISPGVSIYNQALQIAIMHGIEIFGDIELFAREIIPWKSKVIGITGSNGKTTVTSLVGSLANALGVNTLVAGNIGVPVLDSYISINETKKYPELIVLELSSFQLETVYSLSLDNATVLNISEDHLDRYRDLLEYAYVKSNIFTNAKVQVLNYFDVLVMAMHKTQLPVIKFGDVSSGFYIDNDMLYLNHSECIPCDSLKLVGTHNYYNALAGVALLHGAGYDITHSKLKTALMEFNGLSHRMQLVKTTSNGIKFIEDSKGTNVGATVAGVSGLNHMVHLILGGDGKGQDFTGLIDLVKNKCKSVAVIGKDKQLILDALKDIHGVWIKSCETLEQAIDFCYNNALDGEYVVLSPACASWDMFKNYIHRAEVFTTYVQKF